MTVRWKRLDLENLDALLLEADEVIDKYKEALVEDGTEGKSTQRIKRSIDVRLLQIDRFVRQNGGDPRVNLVEMMQNKLRKALDNDVIDASGTAYERITVDSFDKDATFEAGQAYAVASADAGAAAAAAAATPVRGASAGESQGAVSPEHARIAQQQAELLEQQAELDRQRQALARHQEERRVRLAAREEAKAKAANASVASLGPGPSSGGGGESFDGSAVDISTSGNERIRQQQALLQQQEHMLSQLREQQQLMQEQLSLDDSMGGVGTGGMSGSPGGPGHTTLAPEPSTGAGLNSTLASVRKQGRVLIREYLVTLTPEQYEELQTRRKQLMSAKSAKLPYSIHPYLKSRTGKPAYSTSSKKPKYQREASYESPYLNSNGPYVDSSWLDSYFRKDQPDKWVDPRGFEKTINPKIRVKAPSKRGGLPVYDATF